MANLFSNTKQNAVAVTELLLRTLNVKVSRGTIKNALEDHPDFPSMLAVADSLNDWHVQNDTYTIKKEDYDVNDLLFPFIAHFKVNSGVFILVHEFKNAHYIFSDETHYKNIVSEADFLAKWSGIALHATAHEDSGEKDYRINNIKDKFNSINIPLLIGALLIIIFLNIDLSKLNIDYGALLALKLIGLVISILLLMQSINANNPLIQNLCSLGKKNSCNAILKSDAAKITSWLTWSEVGFFYFAGGLLSLILFSQRDAFGTSSLFLLAWLNIFALPYTVYSLSYQYKHKNWCILCCAVQAVLVLEFLTLIFGNFGFSLWSFSFGLNSLYLTPLAFLTPILIWAFLKPFLIKTQQVKPLKNQLKKFKYNVDAFNQALKNQPCFAIPDHLMPVVLGNPNATNIITMVSNPFCGPCAKVHQVIDKWLHYRDNIQLKIIFSTANHDNDEKTKVSRHMSALSLLNNTQLIARALNDWYNQESKKYEDWAEKYPVKFDKEKSDVTTKQKEWCDLTAITATPTILVNGYKLPAQYLIEDIKYLLS